MSESAILRLMGSFLLAVCVLVGTCSAQETYLEKMYVEHGYCYGPIVTAGAQPQNNWYLCNPWVSLAAAGYQLPGAVQQQEDGIQLMPSH